MAAGKRFAYENDCASSLRGSVLGMLFGEIRVNIRLVVQSRGKKGDNAARMRLKGNCIHIYDV